MKVLKIIISSLLILVISNFAPPGRSDEVEECLRLGVCPNEPPVTQFIKMGPFTTYLFGKANKSAKIYIGKDFADVIDRLGTGRVDMAMFCPAQYFEMKRRYPGRFEVLGMLNKAEGRKLKGVITVHKDSGISSIGEIKGKTMAFGDRYATLSFLMQMWEFKKQGIRLKDFKSYQFLGNHENVALSVLTRKFDAGAHAMRKHEKYKDKGLVKIAETEEMPPHIFVVSKSLPDDIKKELKKALFSLNEEEHLPILKNIKPWATGIVEFDEATYETMFKIISTLEGYLD